MFALLVVGKEMRSGAAGQPIIAHEGDKFWVCNESEGWVEATSRNFRSELEIPADIKIFRSAEAAVLFAQRWKGHPWWCSPNGTHSIIEITPKYRKVLDGYTAKIKAFP